MQGAPSQAPWNCINYFTLKTTRTFLWVLGLWSPFKLSLFQGHEWAIHFLRLFYSLSEVIRAEGEESEQANERWVQTLQHCWKRSDSQRVYNLNRLMSEACWDPNKHALMERERKAKPIGPGGKCPRCQWMAGSPMHNAQSWPSKQSILKGPDARSMGCILFTTVTTVLVAFLHVWNEYLNKWGMIICSI